MTELLLGKRRQQQDKINEQFGTSLCEHLEDMHDGDSVSLRRVRGQWQVVSCSGSELNVGQGRNVLEAWENTSLVRDVDDLL